MSELLAAVSSVVALLVSLFLSFKFGEQKQENNALKQEIEKIAQERENAKKVIKTVDALSDSDVAKRVRSIKRKKASK